LLLCGLDIGHSFRLKIANAFSDVPLDAVQFDFPFANPDFERSVDRAGPFEFLSLPAIQQVGAASPSRSAIDAAEWPSRIIWTASPRISELNTRRGSRTGSGFRPHFLSS